jgi:hypothetical protein
MVDSEEMRGVGFLEGIEVGVLGDAKLDARPDDKPHYSTRLSPK